VRATDLRDLVGVHSETQRLPNTLEKIWHLNS
jgi:hypothetical protein